tara:strand:- start:1154 stop:1306 length:153 start_codon:yes stop_codon:yes gene_type:complete
MIETFTFLSRKLIGNYTDKVFLLILESIWFKSLMRKLITITTIILLMVPA